MTEFSLHAKSETLAVELLGPFVGSVTIGSDISRCGIVHDVYPPLEPLHVKISSIPGSTHSLLVSSGSPRVTLYQWVNEQRFPRTGSFQVQHGDCFCLSSDSDIWFWVEIHTQSQAHSTREAPRTPKGPGSPRKTVLKGVLVCLAIAGALGIFYLAGHLLGTGFRQDEPKEEDSPDAVIEVDNGEVKVAFIGDSGYGKTFRKNLELIRAQDADFVVHEGDFDYRRNPKAFWKAIDEVLGHDYPYFLVIGNHDVGAWDGDDGYAAHMEEHIELFNEESTEAMQIDLGTKKNNYRNWTIDFMGLRLVAVGQDNEKNDEKEMFIKDQLDADDPRWKICNWHKNQAAMQVGGKGNEMDWGVYETCREKGALIITGHEHSYERTKTLVHMETQEVDPSCDDRESVCVGPERTFVVVSGLGGREIRNQQRCSKSYKYPYGCEEWAFIYTNQQNAKHGTLFITFNVGGDPKKASGSFINIEDDPVDLFEITKD